MCSNRYDKSVTDVNPRLVIDVDAIANNVAVLRARVGTALMAVVKGNAYGHGLIPAAQAALAGGADALGVAKMTEALLLREAFAQTRIFTWLYPPGSDFKAAARADLELGASAPWAIEQIEQAAATTDRCVRVHLEADTGLGRAGAMPADWLALVKTAVAAVARGTIAVVGVWSHFACADSPGDPTIPAQRNALKHAAAIARANGLTDFSVHLANSAAALNDQRSTFDMVRTGVAIYGLDPLGGDPQLLGLRPAMRVEVPIALVKRVPAGTGVSYGHTYVTARESTLVLVPVGYADGIPRAASGVAPVSINGRRYTISGRVCMDQFVVDVGDDPVQAGDVAVLWADGSDATPTVQDWADAIGTIHYELVTGIGGSFVHHYIGGEIVA